MHPSHCFLIFILLSSVAFIACDEAQQIMKPVMPPELTAQETKAIRIEITPTAEGNPGHGLGNRSVYINAIGVVAFKDDAIKTFPIGTLIIKEINNNTNTFGQHVATMRKTDEPQYTAHNGWRYTQHTREAETAKFVTVAGDVSGSTSKSCHACHAQAPKDSVFTQLPTPDIEIEEVPLPSESEPDPEPESEEETEPQEPEETQTPQETDDDYEPPPDGGPF